MEEVVVTRKFQVTVPKEARETVGIKIGDRLLVEVVDDKIVLRPIKGFDALARLSNISGRFFHGPKKIDAVKLIEGSLGNGFTLMRTFSFTWR